VNISHELLVKALNESRDGITIIDAQQPGFPLVYANQGFEKLTGYLAGEVVGQDYHMLQGTDTDHPEIATVRAAVAKGQGCVVTFRNYRKDGTMFWNQLSVSPVRNTEGALTHFICIQKDATDRIQLEQQLNDLIYTDPLLGIANRRRFDERFKDLLHVARRIHSGMSLLMIDLDHFKQFNQRYGQSAGDDCLRRVGENIAKSFSRASDCVARYGGGEIAVVSLSFGAAALRQHAEKLCEQVRQLAIPNEDSPVGVVTISIGGVHCMPTRETGEDMLMGLVNSKLQAAKRAGRNNALVIG
jgi:diguanylate cyclase (GGDEF)-like protein/PAS domain S-box-containing protein